MDENPTVESQDDDDDKGVVVIASEEKVEMCKFDRGIEALGSLGRRGSRGNWDGTI